MSESTRLLSRKGRLGRKQYWIGVSPLLGYRIALAVIAAYRPDWDWARHSDVLLLFIALLMGKRMRDFGWSALWAIGAVLVLTFVIPLVQVIGWPHAHDTARPLDVLQPATGLLVSLGLIALIVVIGLKKGDPGPNKYGRGPVDHRLAERISAL